MKISSVTISGFRCFCQSPVTIDLDDLTAFVGPNSSGKTAAMMAIAKLFGESTAQRRILAGDFHLEPNEQLKDKKTRTLYLECRLDFPELDEEKGELDSSIPECFNQMIVEKPKATPYCRIRLESTWSDDSTVYGEVEQSLYWILTDSNDPKAIEDGRRKMTPTDRAKIRVIYVPAARDPDQQIHGTTATVFGSLLRSLDWGKTDEEMRKQLAEIQRQLTSLTGIQTLNTHVQKVWSSIYLGRIAKNVRFQAMEEDPAGLIRQLAASFLPSEGGRPIETSGLSDGLRSLFSLSLSLGLFAVERQICENNSTSGFNPNVVDSLPLLTIFAVEEPENHLSPHYLGSIITQLTSTSQTPCAQVVLSSHSPSILGRVQPDNVRYFRGNEHSVATSVISLPLPPHGTDDAFKFVREAIRGYPELYFSSLVIFGEGASEEIVLRRVFEANGTPLDTHFISIVPLGGRHVNHFWRLLYALGIPYLTLLDLDLEKEGGGWGRIQYVRDQLVSLYGAESEKLKFEMKGETVSLADSEFDSLASRTSSKLKGWIEYFESQFRIFFSKPLDLDLSLLEAFPEKYKALIEKPLRGPRLPDPEDQGYDEAVDQRVKQVLTDDISKAPPNLGNTYSNTQRELFGWYKYFFLDGSKPVTHMRAMIAVDDKALQTGLPSALKNLVQTAKQLVRDATKEPDSGAG